RWFGMKEPEKEYQQRRPAEELLCLTPDSGIKPRPLCELAGELGAGRAESARKRLAGLAPELARQRLQEARTPLLGDAAPAAAPTATARGSERVGDATVERVVLEVEPQIAVPLLLLLPGKGEGRLPVVVGVSQHGKQEFLKQRGEAIAELLRGGVAV